MGPMVGINHYLVVALGTVLQKQGKHKTCRAGRSFTIATLDLRRRLELGRLVVPWNLSDGLLGMQ
jgi:hypothetical protein